MEQKIGVVIALIVFGVVGVFLYLNLQKPQPPGARPQLVGTDAGPSGDAGGVPASMEGIERFIGRTEHSAMQITAVWLPPIQMEGMDLPQDANVIHLEADIVALERNPNGFGAGSWIPYLPVEYEIVPAESGKGTIRGEFLPMVAKDGPHYGATIQMPGPGKFRLVYKIGNPGQNGFGRHSDPITGVAPWWDPFSVEFDFDFPGGSPPSSTAAEAGN